MPKPAKKKTKVLAKAGKIGELEAIRNFNSKWTKAKWKNFITDRLKEGIDKLDPLKTLAILSATVLIKGGIEWAEDLMTVPVDSDIFRTIYRMGLGVIGLLIPPSPEAMQQKERLKALMDSPTMEMFQWGMSFLCAYLLVEHAGELITAGGDIIGSAKGLIGMLKGV